MAACVDRVAKLSPAVEAPNDSGAVRPRGAGGNEGPRTHPDNAPWPTGQAPSGVRLAADKILADGASDVSLDLGRRHPTNGSGTPRLSVQEG